MGLGQEGRKYSTRSHATRQRLTANFVGIIYAEQVVETRAAASAFTTRKTRLVGLLFTLYAQINSSV
jgi:hypothetical protein